MRLGSLACAPCNSFSLRREQVAHGAAAGRHVEPRQLTGEDDEDNGHDQHDIYSVEKPVGLVSQPSRSLIELMNEPANGSINPALTLIQNVV